MELLTLMRKGDELALKELFDRHYIDLCDQAAARLKDAKSHSDDIVQQVFIDFWSQKRFETVEDNVKGYLAQMMHFKASSFLRNEVRKKENLNKYLGSNTQGPVADSAGDDDNEKIKLLHDQIVLLPPQCREVFIAAYMEEKTYQEVADRLGISKNTVKSHMKTAIAKMKAALKGFVILAILFFINNSPYYQL
jgi:RNA polymerase sigma factor (sigma-70 family)